MPNPETVLFTLASDPASTGRFAQSAIANSVPAATANGSGKEFQIIFIHLTGLILPLLVALSS